MFWHCYCFYDLSKKLLSILGLLRLFLKLRILLFGRFICLAIAGHFIFQLLIKSFSMSLYLLRFDKIFDLSYFF